jgi:putative transcription factor
MVVPSVQCEVCGRQIIGEPHRVIIERAKMTTCSSCAKLGSAEWKPEPASRTSPAAGITLIPRTAFIKKRGTASISEDIVVAEGYGLLVRRAREKAGLSHEELGRRIAERVSVLKKVESEKMVPDQKVSEKLEHALGVKLMVPLVVPKVPPTSTPLVKGVTLGEIAELKEAKRRSQK